MYLKKIFQRESSNINFITGNKNDVFIFSNTLQQPLNISFLFFSPHFLSPPLVTPSPVYVCVHKHTHHTYRRENTGQKYYYTILTFTFFFYDTYFTFFMLKIQLIAQVISNSLRPQGLQLTRLLCRGDFSGKNTGVGCHSLLQGIFWNKGLKRVVSPASPALQVDTLSSEPPIYWAVSAVQRDPYHMSFIHAYIYSVSIQYG